MKELPFDSKLALAENTEKGRHGHMTTDERALLKQIGSQVKGPRHVTVTPSEPGVLELLSNLIEQRLVESTGFVHRMGGESSVRVCLTGRGWVKFKEMR